MHRFGSLREAIGEQIVNFRLRSVWRPGNLGRPALIGVGREFYLFFGLPVLWIKAATLR
jgi:hypothetical protein